MKPERIQDPSKTLAGWSYRQRDELRRSFTLGSYSEALNFTVALIELAEDFALQPAFQLRDRQLTVDVPVPAGGISEQVEAFVEGLGELQKRETTAG